MLKPIIKSDALRLKSKILFIVKTFLKMKKLGLILLINGFLCLFCFGQQKDTMTYINPEIQPTFKYDTCSNLRSSIKNYFIDNYKMPDILLNNGYMGSIYVETIVESDSTHSNVKLLRGIDKPLDKSVIETIKEMPKWSPGINKGRIVRTRIIIPISIHWLYGKME